MLPIKYPVIEMFQSIQGEGVHQGKCVIFVRLAGCNLKCEFCDTDFSEAKATNMTAEQIIKTIKAEDYTANIVVITGGEPTIHNLTVLTSALFDYGFQIYLETNGTNKLPHSHMFRHISASPKPPEYALNIERYSELKYVVSAEFDMEKVEPQIQRALAMGLPVFLQVESCKKESIDRIMEYIKAEPRLRLGTQVHKYLEVQ